MGKKDKLLDSTSEGACAGESIVEMMESVLDGLFTYLKQTDMETADRLDVEAKKGEANGVAKCIAIIYNPYYPNVDSVKADAVRRWEYREKRAKRLLEEEDSSDGVDD